MPATQFNRVIEHIHRLTVDRRTQQFTDSDLLENFARNRDERSFAALVSRHGLLVYRVCRRVLSHEQDAEDAFQAVFLILASQCKSIRKRDSLAEWLHGVAYRTAMKASRTAARRRHYEAIFRKQLPAACTNPVWDDLQLILDEEIQRLPSLSRAAFVACVLEGKSGREAAVELGIPGGTVSSRLNWAKKRLQQRLARRGIELGVLLAAVHATARSAPVLPAHLANHSWLSGVMSLASGIGCASIPASVSVLASRVMRAGLLAKLKPIVGALVALVLTAVATQQLIGNSQPGLKAGQAFQKEASQSSRMESTSAAKDKSNETVTCRGQVFDPEGRPVSGAKLYLSQEVPGAGEEPVVRATSNANGRFDFAFQRGAPNRYSHLAIRYQVLAVADGFGPAWSFGEFDKQGTDVTLQLVEARTIRGRILDLEGKPVPGAILRVEHIEEYADLEAFFKSVRDRNWFLGQTKHWNGPFPGQPRTIVTGVDGGFAWQGAGQDRLVQFHVEGPGIQFASIRALDRDMTSPVEPRLMQYGPVILKVYGATFDHAALPSRPIRGIVRDMKTGLPVPDIEVTADRTSHRTRTDESGAFELLGCPKRAEGYQVSFACRGKPYFGRQITVPDTPGLSPIKLDLDLPGGIVVQGRIAHHKTGKPLPGVRIEYYPLYPNPQVRLFGPNQRAAFPCSASETAADGTYKLVVLPGPGALGFASPSLEEFFEPALVTMGELKTFFGDDEDHGTEQALRIQVDVNGWNMIAQEQFNQLVLIRPAESAQSLACDVSLRTSLPLAGRVTLADGRPATKVDAYGTTPQTHGPMKADTFLVQGLNPRRSRPVVFIDRAADQAVLLTVTGETKSPLIVRLQPCGSASGLLLDQDGLPLVNATVRLDAEDVRDTTPERVQTDARGRFRFDGLVPGQKYQARRGLPPYGQYLGKPIVAGSNATEDLGQLTVKPVR